MTWTMCREACHRCQNSRFEHVCLRLTQHSPMICEPVLHKKSIRLARRYIHYYQGETMKKRYILLGVPSVILVIVVAGLLYMAHFTSVVSQTKANTAPGSAKASTSPIPSTGLSTFHTVSPSPPATHCVTQN